MIKLKHDKLFLDLAMWPKIEDNLAVVIFNAAEYVRLHFEEDLVITSLWRGPDEQAQVNPGRPTGSTHGTVPCRGSDIRSFIYTPPQRKELVDHLNALFVYDPERLHLNVAVLEADHIHLQVHPRTLMNHHTPED